MSENANLPFNQYTVLKTFITTYQIPGSLSHYSTPSPYCLGSHVIYHISLPFNWL